jgi:Spy/CpxP family protein refolding chaperone
LRFLAYRLELDDDQVQELAEVLADLKTERAQAEVDSRRTMAGFADTLTGEAFDNEKANQTAQQRVQSAERLRDAVVKALARIHGLLEPPQREKLAYLIRTGQVTI